MLEKYGWYHSLMITANKDPRLVDYWLTQPMTALLQYMAYLQDEAGKESNKIN